jgi:hypothetical protein
MDLFQNSRSVPGPVRPESLRDARALTTRFYPTNQRFDYDKSIRLCGHIIGQWSRLGLAMILTEGGLQLDVRVLPTAVPVFQLTNPLQFLARST